MERTALVNLLESTHETAAETITPSNMEINELIETFYDGSVSFGNRKRVFEEIIKRDPDLSRETISNICKSYEHSRSKDIISFICFLLDFVKLDIFQQFQCILTLNNSNYPGTSSYILQILKQFIEQDKTVRPSVVIFIDTIRYLLNDLKVLDRTTPYVTWLVNESALPAKFLFKTIKSIQLDQEMRPIQKEYLDCLYKEFFNSKLIDDQHRILSAQYLLSNELNIENVERVIINISRAVEVEYNTRADAADLLLKLGTVPSQKIGLEIINELGKDTTSLPQTVSSNRQNVHLVDESVNKFLSMLGSIKLDVIVDVNTGAERVQTVDEIIQKVKQHKQYHSNSEKINNSLLRIRLDQIIYPGSQSLVTIFQRIFQMIEKHEFSETLFTRLIEELIDMADTCSTGHVNRLVNIFSGIDGFFLDIGFKNQIQSNIAGRIQERINKIEDKSLKECIVSEMNEEEMKDRIHYTSFIRHSIDDIYKEMYKEFVADNLLSDEEFTLFFREGIQHFEVGE